MSKRISLAQSLIRFGEFIQGLAIAVMRPDDLVGFSKQTYSRLVKGWGRDQLVMGGLKPEESDLLEKTPVKEGRLLLLGVGGGREAIPLVRKGFLVTGLDYVPAMVESAKENARKQGLEIDGLVQDIGKLELPAESYELVWLSAAMYSCVPTRQRRVEMLRRIEKALAPDGYFVCGFHWGKATSSRSGRERVKRLIAWFTRGNLQYEKGDILLGNREFIHISSSLDELRSEFLKGGFEITHVHIPKMNQFGGAVLKKL